MLLGHPQPDIGASSEHGRLRVFLHTGMPARQAPAGAKKRSPAMFNAQRTRAMLYVLQGRESTRDLGGVLAKHHRPQPRR